MSEVNKGTFWVVSEPFYPEMTSTGYYLTKIAEGLAGQVKVKVICGQPNYLAQGVTGPSHEIHNGVEIFRVWGSRLDRRILLLRMVNMVSFGISAMCSALWRFRRGDRVLVVTTPPLTPFVVAAAALFKGSAFFLLIHDLYPDLAIASGKAKETSWLVRMSRIANRWLYKHASKIVVVGRDMKDVLTSRSEGLDSRIEMIPNWAELDIVEPRPKKTNELINRLRLDGKFVVLYAGNMGYPNDVESILDAALKLKDRESLHFLFIGDGVKRRWIEKRIARSALDNVTILPPSPRSDQIVFLNACDIGIVTLVKGMRGVSMPSRTYNLLAAGKPILAICEPRSELEALVTENKVGFVVPPGSSDALVAMIEAILNSPEQLESMGTRARAVAIEEYSPDEAIKKYRNALL